MLKQPNGSRAKPCRITRLRQLTPKDSFVTVLDTTSRNHTSGIPARHKQQTTKCPPHIRHTDKTQKLSPRSHLQCKLPRIGNIYLTITARESPEHSTTCVFGFHILRQLPSNTNTSPNFSSRYVMIAEDISGLDLVPTPR